MYSVWPYLTWEVESTQTTADKFEAPNISTIYEKLLELDKRQP